MMRGAQTREVLSFGPFRLVVNERLLTKDGAHVAVSGRALDILIALLEHPNELVDKKDLLARVWPDVRVEEGSLRFHIARLRKALGDGNDGARYIETLSGRGYCFVAPVFRSYEQGEATPEPAGFSHTNLPARLAGVIGREDDIQNVCAKLSAARLVTILGAGGIGKTTVAIAVGHHLADAYGGAVVFVDLSMQRDPNTGVAMAVAAMLGLPVQSEDPVQSLVAHLRNRQMLLILDTCEHLIEAVAAMASRILTGASQVHLLATSRETLQIEGEHVYRLDPLACPPDDAALTAAAVTTFPATQLFVERATAGGAQLNLSDAEAAVVADICRKLDGMALAIELAARRVGAYGLHQTAALLDRRLTLLWVGSRTAPPRQKTLQATLDWSYGLLSETERMVLRRLAVFVGPFTLDAALAVVTSTEADQTAIYHAIDSLVAKSIVVPRPVGASMRYRLLDTTRAYALELSADDGTAGVTAQHANYYRRWLAQIAGDSRASLSAGERALLLADLNNVRAALEWCFGERGDPIIGVELASAAAPVFLSLSLLTDCQRWSERAILAMGDNVRGSDETIYRRAEMALQEALGQSLMYTERNSEKALAALERALELAEALNDSQHQLQLLLQLHMFHRRTGNIGGLLAIASRAEAVAVCMAEPVAIAGARSMIGLSHHLLGNHGMVHANVCDLLTLPSRSSMLRALRLGFHPDRTRAVLARTLWLQGSVDQAVLAATQMIRSPSVPQDPVNRCIILIFGVNVLQWAGNLARAEQYIVELGTQADRHSLAPFITVTDCLKGELLLRQGEMEKGIELLRNGLYSLQAERYELYNTGFHATLAEALVTSGHHEFALMMINDVIARAQRNSDLLFMPELRRIRGDILVQKLDEQGAEDCFEQAIALAEEQKALSWRLRAVLSLARLRSRQGRKAEAKGLIAETYARFTEGFGTADLVAARRFMD
jgi:predicted ATPase/DNA-binding winged helix-turn-helix (wHTH) protein